MRTLQLIKRRHKIIDPNNHCFDYDTMPMLACSSCNQPEPLTYPKATYPQFLLLCRQSAAWVASIPVSAQGWRPCLIHRHSYFFQLLWNGQSTLLTPGQMLRSYMGSQLRDATFASSHHCDTLSPRALNNIALKPPWWVIPSLHLLFTLIGDSKGP